MITELNKYFCHLKRFVLHFFLKITKSVVPILVEIKMCGGKLFTDIFFICKVNIAFVFPFFLYQVLIHIYVLHLIIEF